MTQKAYPHIGKGINRVLAEKGLKKSWLAARIHKSPAAISKLIKSPTIDLYLLIDISTALQYDFLEFMEQIKQNQ